MEKFHLDLDLVSSFERFNLGELEYLVELSDDTTSDEQIVLYIYLCIHIYQKWHKEEYRERASRRVKAWEAMELASSAHHQRRCNILNAIFAQGQQQQQDATQIQETLATNPR